MAGKRRTVVKHSYVTGRDRGVARAYAHVRYIQFRPGKDIERLKSEEEEARSFFDARRDQVYGWEVKEAVSEQDPRGVVIHKLILSPGVEGVEVQEYCREVMADLGSRKGLDLEWYAVRHDNTAHSHVHIVVMGKDLYGHRVKIGKRDYERVKEVGDRYLERNRYIDREDRDKEREIGDERISREIHEQNVVKKFFNALKKAAKEFQREFSRSEFEGETKKESKYEERKKLKEIEKEAEIAALGEAPDFNEYIARQEDREEREKISQEKAWKKYCEPIVIKVEGGKGERTYDRGSSLKALRDLERRYEEGEDCVIQAVDKDEIEKLQYWIKEKYKENKLLEKKVQKKERIELNLADTDDGQDKWTKFSSIEELRKLDELNRSGEVFLDEIERRALSNWIREKEYSEPVEIQLEAGGQALIYDRKDSKESLRYLVKEYACGAHWARENISYGQYCKVKSWISEKESHDQKDRRETEELNRSDEEQGVGARQENKEQAEKRVFEQGNNWNKEEQKEADRIKLGERYISKGLDISVLERAREEMSKNPESNKREIEKLDLWIKEKSFRESGKYKEGLRSNSEQRVGLTDRRMKRAQRQERAQRIAAYFNQKSQRQERLEAQRENLKAQKRAMDKYEKERETVDGEYSEIWGADKSGVAAGARGAASGGARPLGANQFVRMITQAKAAHAEKEKYERKKAADFQKNLRQKLDNEKKMNESVSDKAAEKTLEGGEYYRGTKDKDLAMPKLGSTEKQETENKEIEKDVKAKKQKERDRDPRKRAEDRDSFDFDPWGRF